MVISTKGTKAFVPKHTSNYNAETVANTQSIFLPDASTAITTDVSVSIQFWLRKRGQAIQTPMTEAQKKQLKECFELIDTDGSGSLDLKEMFELFDVSQKSLTSILQKPGCDYCSLTMCAFLRV